MVQKVKDRIIHALIVVITGIVVSIFSVAYANNKLDSKEQIKIIEGKVDKTEFEKYKAENETAHLKLESDRKEDIKEYKEFMNIRFDDLKDFLKKHNK